MQKKSQAKTIIVPPPPVKTGRSLRAVSLLSLFLPQVLKPLRKLPVFTSEKDKYLRLHVITLVYLLKCVTKDLDWHVSLWGRWAPIIPRTSAYFLQLPEFTCLDFCRKLSDCSYTNSNLKLYIEPL